VARIVLYRLHPLCEVIPLLRHGRLTGADLLQTFFRRQVQLLHQDEITMWMYPGPCCPDRPFNVELGDTEVNTRVHGVLSHGAVPDLGMGPIPLREGVDNPCVCPLRPSCGYLFQFWFLNVCVILCRVLSMFTMPRGGSPYLRMW
jgi:hypothetical protein